LCVSHGFSNPEQVRMYTILRGLIWNNMFEYLPRAEYCFEEKEQDAQTELRQLLLVNKNKIDHPETGSKDISDVLAMVGYFTLLSEYAPTMSVDIQPEMKYSLDEYARRYFASIQELTKQLKRGPSEEELAKYMQVPLDWLYEIREYATDPVFHSKSLGDVMPES